MKKRSVLIYRCCRLRSAVTIPDGEIKSANAVGAEGACECRASMYRFDCVISHTIILSLYVRYVRPGVESPYDYSSEAPPEV
jgi:hypothetical protein